MRESKALPEGSAVQQRWGAPDHRTRCRTLASFLCWINRSLDRSLEYVSDDDALNLSAAALRGCGAAAGRARGLLSSCDGPMAVDGIDCRRIAIQA